MADSRVSPASPAAECLTAAQPPSLLISVEAQKCVKYRQQRLTCQPRSGVSDSRAASDRSAAPISADIAAPAQEAHHSRAATATALSAFWYGLGPEDVALLPPSLAAHEMVAN